MEIEIGDSIKILGVTLDSKLSFREHITEQLKKAYSKATALRRIRRFIPIDVMIRLYKAFVLPHLEYCSPLFVGIGKVHSNRIDNANYYILSTLLGHAKTVPYEQLLKTVGMLNLRDRRNRQSLILLYKCLYCSGPRYICDFFNYRRTNYSLRGDGFNLTLPKFNLQRKKKSFSYVVSQLSNKLPLKVRQAANLKDFKQNLMTVEL